MIPLLMLLACPPADRAWRGTGDSGEGGPSLAWVWPEEGALLAAGEALSVQARITDPDDPVEALTVRLEVDGALLSPTLSPDGLLTAPLDLTAGPHAAALDVGDPAGNQARASLAWSGNAAPVVAISAPADGATLAAGQAWTAVIDATDPDLGLDGRFLVVELDGVEVGRLEPWNPDGQPLELAMPGLGSGAHTLYVEASDGLSRSDAALTVYGS